MKEKEAMITKRRAIEKELGKRGWAVKLNYKHSIIENIGFSAQLLSDENERRAFVEVAREVLEEKGVLSKERRKIRKKERLQKKVFLENVQKEMHKENLPIKLNNGQTVRKSIHFATRCQTLYPEERREIERKAESVLNRFN